MTVMKVTNEQLIVYQLGATWTQIIFPLAVRILTVGLLVTLVLKSSLRAYTRLTILIEPWHLD